MPSTTRSTSLFLYRPLALPPPLPQLAPSVRLERTLAGCGSRAELREYAENEGEERQQQARPPSKPASGRRPAAAAAASLAVSSLGAAKSSLGDTTRSLGDAKSSLGDAESSLGDAKSSLGDAKSSLGDAKSSLGDAKSSLGDVQAETARAAAAAAGRVRDTRAVVPVHQGRGEHRWERVASPVYTERSRSPRSASARDVGAPELRRSASPSHGTRPPGTIYQPRALYRIARPHYTLRMRDV
jgi:hypothetical protein